MKTLAHGISARLTPRLFVSNIKHSLDNTTLVIDRDPVIAKEQLCQQPHEGR